MTTLRAGPVLTREERDRFRRDGILVRRGAFTGREVAQLRAECDRVTSDPAVMSRTNLRARDRAHADGGRIIDRLDPVGDLSPAFDRVGVDPRLLGPAEELLGMPLRRFKDKLILKAPGTAGYGIHQDFAYWQMLPVTPETAISTAVALDDATEETGAIEVFVGQHQRLLTPPGAAVDPTLDQVDAGAGELLLLRAGDAFFMHGLLPHRSGPNGSRVPRRKLYVMYAAAAHGDLTGRYFAAYHERQRAGMSSEDRTRAHYA